MTGNQLNKSLRSRLGEQIADHVDVMQTGTVLSEGSREDFGGDTETVVARRLYASGDS